jgi:hypothetical protein
MATADSAPEQATLTLSATAAGSEHREFVIRWRRGRRCGASQASSRRPVAVFSAVERESPGVVTRWDEA